MNLSTLTALRSYNFNPPAKFGRVHGTADFSFNGPVLVDWIGVAPSAIAQAIKNTLQNNGWGVINIACYWESNNVELTGSVRLDWDCDDVNNNIANFPHALQLNLLESALGSVTFIHLDRFSGCQQSGGGTGGGGNSGGGGNNSGDGSGGTRTGSNPPKTHGDFYKFFFNDKDELTSTGIGVIAVGSIALITLVIKGKG